MEVKISPCCSQCGASRKPSELNGSFLKDGSWDYSKAYCSRLAECDSEQANTQIDGLLEDSSIEVASKKEFMPPVFYDAVGYDSTVPTISPDNVFLTIKKMIEECQEKIRNLDSRQDSQHLFFETYTLQNVYGHICIESGSPNYLVLDDLIESFEKEMNQDD